MEHIIGKLKRLAHTQYCTTKSITIEKIGNLTLILGKSCSGKGTFMNGIMCRIRPNNSYYIATESSIWKALDEIPEGVRASVFDGMNITEMLKQFGKESRNNLFIEQYTGYDKEQMELDLHQLYQYCNRTGRSIFICISLRK